MSRPSHDLGDCPNGTEWCDPEDHLCGECQADWTDRAYDAYKDDQITGGA